MAKKTTKKTKKNTKVKLTRREQFDAKRAARLEERGATADTIRTAQVGLAGIGDGADQCALCDHAIKWLYTLHLRLENDTLVTFEPVGSSCIETWADSLPAGEAQQAILDALKLATDEAAVLKTRFRTINKLEKSGKLDEEQATALIEFYASPAKVRASSFLSDVADKVIKYGYFTTKQWSSWSFALRRDLGNLNAPKCGACGGRTTYRSGRYGEFYGCCSYPHCRWTQNIKWTRRDVSSDSDSGTGKVEKTKATKATKAKAPAPAVAGVDYDEDDLPF